MKARIKGFKVVREPNWMEVEVRCPFCNALMWSKVRIGDGKASFRCHKCGAEVEAELEWIDNPSLDLYAIHRILEILVEPKTRFEIISKAGIFHLNWPRYRNHLLRNNLIAERYGQRKGETFYYRTPKGERAYTLLNDALRLLGLRT